MHLLKIASVIGLVFLAIPACNSSSSGGSTGSSPLSEASAVKVASTTPPDGSKGISVQSSVSVQFSQPVDPASLTPATFTLFRGGNQVPGSVTSNGLSATFTPTGVLGSTAPYKATITKGVKDTEGKALASEFSWVFTTQDTLAPFVAATEPFANAQHVPVTTALAAAFSEEMDPSTIHAGTFTVVGPLGPVAGTVSYSAKTALFQPAAPLQPLGPVNFSATIAGSVADTSGNALGANYSWTFTTQDQTPPLVVSMTPVVGAGNIPFTVNPAVTFNETMDPTSLSTQGLSLLENGAVPVPGTVFYDASTNTATFDPIASLKANTLYVFRVNAGAAGAKDLAGNPVSGGCLNCETSFTTISGWAPPANIESLDFDASNPQMLAAPASSPFAGNLFAVWQQRTTTTATSAQDIWAAMYSPSSGTWTAPVRVENASGDAANPVLAIEPNGTLMVVFQQKIGTETQFSMFAVGFDPSLGWPGGWGTPVVLETETTTATAAINPQVAAGPDGSFAAVYQQKVTGQTGVNSIVGNRFDPTNGTWSAATTLESSTFEASLPQVAAAENGDFIVVFQQKSGTGTAPNDIMATRYEASAGWAAAPVLIETGDFDAQNPKIAVIPSLGAPNAGQIMAVWQQKNSTNEFTIFSAVYDSSSAAWSGEVKIETAPGESTFPFLAAGGDGSFAAIWLKKIGGEIAPSVVVNRYVLGSGWGPEGVLIESVDGNSNQNVRIAITRNGRVMAVWDRLDGFAFSVVANEMQIGGTWDPAAVISVESAAETATKSNIAATPSNGFYAIFQQIKPSQTVYSIFVGEAP